MQLFIVIFLGDGAVIVAWYFFLIDVFIILGIVRVAILFFVLQLVSLYSYRLQDWRFV